MPGLVPGISLRMARCPPYRDHRDKPGDDELGVLNAPRSSRCVLTPERQPIIFSASAASDMSVTFSNGRTVFWVPSVTFSFCMNSMRSGVMVRSFA